MASLAPAPIGSEELDTLGRVVKAIGDTEFVPRPLRGRPGAILAAILYGRALGLDGMVALREVHLIDGTPSLSATAVLGRIRADGHSVQLEEGANQCVARGRRADNGDEHVVVFTMADAETAGLLGKANWAKYPRAMLRSRAVTELARALFSDVFAGVAVYTPDELGADTPPDDQAEAVNPARPTDVVHKARARHFALLDEFSKQPGRRLPPDAEGNWDVFSGHVALDRLGVHSRASLDADGWDRLTEQVELLTRADPHPDAADIPFA